MSKGPGALQRMILDELKIKKAFSLKWLLKPNSTKAQYNSLLRAALKLEANYKISIHRFALGGARTYVHRYGITIQGADRSRLDQVKCMSNTHPVTWHTLIHVNDEVLDDEPPQDLKNVTGQ